MHLVNDQRAYCVLGSINFAWSFFTFAARKKKNTLFTGLGLPAIEKNCNNSVLIPGYQPLEEIAR